jgi:pimeloyl-ACP methyl ester carboxylesterase
MARRTVLGRRKRRPIEEEGLRPVTRRFATTADGLKIAYEIEGAGASTLTLVHGWTCNRSFWRAQVDEFSKAYRVVTIDLGGHGDSGTGRGDWTMRRFGADVATVLLAEQLSDVVLAGHSMGGKVIVEAAYAAPDRVKAIVGVDTFKSLRQVTSAEAQARRMRRFEDDYEATAREFIASMFVGGTDPGLVQRVTTEMMRTPREVGIGAMTDLLATDPAFGRVRSLPLPKVLINSDYRPTDRAAVTDAGFGFMLMPGVGHFVMMEEPAAFNRLLRAALSQVRAA